MSYNNSYGKSDYYSGSRGGYHDSYHSSSRGSSRGGGGGRSYSSRGGGSSGGSQYYQGSSSSSRYQGSSSYGGSSYNSSSSRNNDDSYRAVRYAESKSNYRSPQSSYELIKRPRVDSDSRYSNSNSVSSSYKAPYNRHESSYNSSYPSSLKREYEKAKARDYIFTKPSAPYSSSRYSRGTDRPSYRSRGRGRSSGGGGSSFLNKRSSYSSSGPSAYAKSKLLESRYRKKQLIRISYQAERIRKMKRIQEMRARKRAELRERAVEWDKKQKEKEEDDKKENEVSEEEEVEEEVEEELEGEEEADEVNDKDKETEDTTTGVQGEEANGSEAKPAAPKKKKVTRKVIKVIKKVVKKKALGAKEKLTNGDSSDKITDGRIVFKLDCPTCKLSCITYREYTLHLYTDRHMDAMKKLVGTLRVELNKMRVEQRDEQKEYEEKHRNDGSGLSTLYCEMCKLNYRQLKIEHVRSARHKKMREFLIPICKLCHLTCKSQMAYQNHLCSISHLKAEQRVRIADERRAVYRAEKDAESKDVNMDNFMVLDSVGSADEDEEEEIVGEDGNKKKVKKEREIINVGHEFVKKVTAYYCELCNFYLPREGDEADILHRHCQNRAHMKRYVNARDDLALRKKAEKLHRELEKLNEEEEKEKAAAASKLKVKEETEDAKETVGAGEESDEDDEENSSGRRYDRFQAGSNVKKIDIDDDIGKELEGDKKEELVTKEEETK